MSSVISSEDSSTERSFENCRLLRGTLFAIERMVTLGKTNAFGGAYFAEFFAWTGEAREELLGCGGLPEGISFHTSEARMKYFRELLPLERFEIVVWPRIGRMNLSLDLRFFFIRGGDLVAVGDQRICLKADGQLVPIPAALVDTIGRFAPA